MLLLVASTWAVAQAPQYKVGDRVECDATQMGTFKKGTIVAFPKNDPDQAGRFYYVRLDGSYITDGYLCMATHMRPLVESAPARPDGQARNPVSPAKPPGPAGAPQAVAPRAATPSKAFVLTMAGGLPTLPGTAWKIDFGIKGGNVQRFLFCRSGRWEVVSSQLLTGGAMSMMGSYTVNGPSLVTRDANGGKVTTYRMAWNGKVLELDSGKAAMKLYEPVETACK